MDARVCKMRRFKHIKVSETCVPAPASSSCIHVVQVGTNEPAQKGGRELVALLYAEGLRVEDNFMDGHFDSILLPYTWFRVADRELGKALSAEYSLRQLILRCISAPMADSAYYPRRYVDELDGYIVAKITECVMGSPRLLEQLDAGPSVRYEPNLSTKNYRALYDECRLVQVWKGVKERVEASGPASFGPLYPEGYLLAAARLGDLAVCNLSNGLAWRQFLGLTGLRLIN